ncbi:inactive glucose-1-phosphate adenylyltransferase small subunit 2, chloroplastic isoform X2 [Rhododendron vialii]|uniref:inactive glucose-1-phosphate adenylyltransferase small subunit 2, chloroplastic isoform X2 n=1 Tax=Rhododendron vialii TaxID=182163 RepID=UPI00265E5CF9|nr:inactive glucose-1-phosphate adenylyltransferase small subunit 2, chloroplastic isoform X2 [Rhododendron vialii]
MLELSVPTSANLKAKLLVAGLDRKHHQPRPPKLHSSILPSLSITNSQQPAQPVALFPPVNQSVAAIVFGDGSDSRLYPLTKRRSEGAIPIAANYRLIDAVVSNCINSNINKIYALTQFNSTSLNSHLTRAYSGVGLGKEGFVEVIAACQSPEYNGWFQGTADAIRRCLWVLEEYPIVEFLVLPGHHLYKMDYQKLIEAHRKKKSDVTCAVLTGKKNQVSEFGIFEVNSDNKVTNFREKPDKNPMKPILVNAYRFDGYWEDMRSIEAFYDANMESTKKANMGYNFYDKDSPLYTLPRNLPPSLVTDAVITDSVIGDGCILNKCSIKGTVVGMRTRIGDGALIEDSVLMGSDIYQIQDVQTNGSEGMGIPIGIGEGSHIRRAIVDKNARIGKNVMIINKDNVQEANMEAHGYSIKEGIVIILRSAVIKDGSIL